MLRGFFAQNMNSKYLLSMLSCQRARPLRLLTLFASTSPKGRGLGKEMKFAWTAKGSHFGGAVKADRH